MSLKEEFPYEKICQIMLIVHFVKPNDD